MNQSIERQAIEWHVRLRHGGDETWEAFIVWLGESAAHQAAYDRVVQTDQELEVLLPQIRFASVEPSHQDEHPHRHRRWLPVGILTAGVAAGVAATVGLFGVNLSDRYEVSTSLGETRQVAIGAGSSVRLNGSTRLLLDRKDSRFASLVAGEALFSVEHDPQRPFTLEVGDDRIQDVGTVFNVVHDRDGLRIGVAEGEVLYNPKREAVRLTAGQGLETRTGNAAVVVRQTNPETVGSWRSGQLVYSRAPLSEVASDLSRALGIDIRVAPAIAKRPFSGTLVLEHKGSGELKRIASLLNATIKEMNGYWIIAALE